MKRFLLIASVLLGACATSFQPPLAKTVAGRVLRRPPPPPPPGWDMTPHPHTFVCQAFAQPLPSYDPLKSLGEIRMSEPGDRSVSGGGFKFTVSYGNDAIDGLVINTGVSWKSTGKLIEHSLFQFDPQKGPVNQFGGFGFTGLHYVYAPDSTARLQYTCKVAE